MVWRSLSAARALQDLVMSGLAAFMAPSRRASPALAFAQEGGDFRVDLAATELAALAVKSMAQEVLLTPKPGLVDGRGSGAHDDLDLPLMLRSASSLMPCFIGMAQASARMAPGSELRARLAEIGREGERAMFAATAGINTHKGAIWALGLLVGAAANCAAPYSPAEVAGLAGLIARHPDRAAQAMPTHGSRVCARYGVGGARGEAQAGFPHALEAGLPALRRARVGGAREDEARLDALLAIMAELDDTCLLHRGGEAALAAARSGARAVLQAGGVETPAGRAALTFLDADLLRRRASPGGSGDLLAVTLFLDALAQPSTTLLVDFVQHGESQPWKF